MKKALVQFGIGVGDTVMTMPAAKVAHDLGYEVHAFATTKHARYLGLVADLPFVAHAYSGPHPREHYDLILLPEIVWPKDGWLSWLRPGGLNAESPIFDRLPPEDRHGAHQHQSALTCEPLRTLGWNGEVPMPEVAVDRSLVVKDGKYVVLAPDCKPAWSWPRKTWTEENWAELARRIRAMGLVPVVLGDKVDRPWIQASKGLNPLGPPGLRAMVAMLAGARAIVAIDNGPGHVAAALGVPLVTLCGPSNPIHTAPRGPGRIIALSPKAECAPCLYTPRFEQPCALPCPCMAHMPEEVAHALESIL